MLEIFVLIGSITGITAMARGRGGTPWIYGLIAGAGYVVLALTSRAMLPGEVVAPMLIPLLPIALTALYVRFWLGRQRLKPSGIWTCKSCHYVNQGYSVICEACKKPWARTE